MSHEISHKLKSSLDSLERSIKGTRAALLSKEGVPAYVHSHVENYLDILAKQRMLAEELEESLAVKDFEKVARSVKIINGLSTMIKEDAQSLLAGTDELGFEEPWPKNYC